MTFAAGDGALDAEMLRAADSAIRPRHGELEQLNWTNPNLTITSASGILAGEEIINWFINGARRSRSRRPASVLDLRRSRVFSWLGWSPPPGSAKEGGYTPIVQGWRESVVEASEFLRDARGQGVGGFVIAHSAQSPRASASRMPASAATRNDVTGVRCRTRPGPSLRPPPDTARPSRGRTSLRGRGGRPVARVS